MACPIFVQDGGYPLCANAESPDGEADGAVDEARVLEGEPQSLRLAGS